MICYKDMTFCSAKCATLSCFRNFTPVVAAAAERWWGEPGAPVAFMDFSATCPEYVPVPPPETAP